MTDVLNFSDVTLFRGTKFLLDEVNFTAEENEHWAILGPNGAGKTTLLEIAAGRMHPSRGTVEILGERLGKVDVFELRPRIGYASAALAARIPRGESVLDLVVTASYGVVGRWREEYDPEDLDRARNLLWAFGISELADRKFGTLSEGEKKRVQVARALMTDPEMLLLDEPAAGLDLGGREELMRALTEILESGVAPSLFMVTHHVEEIPRGITHAALMRDGRIVAAGPIAETLSAENLTETFGLGIDVTETDGRYHATARH